jgi:dTMP kinase
MLIAIEGIDGAGKRTLSTHLAQILEQEGRDPIVISFPRYGKSVISGAISSMLAAPWGQVGAIRPEATAALFATERFEVRDDIARWLDSGKTVITDRYIFSNIAYQGARLPEFERDRFIEWIIDLEVTRFQAPKPSVAIYLDIPVSEAQRRVSMRTLDDRPYGGDAYESNEGLLKQARALFAKLAEDGLLCPWLHVPIHREQQLDPSEVAYTVWDWIKRQAPINVSEHK